MKKPGAVGIALILSILFVLVMEFVPLARAQVLHSLLGLFVILIAVFWNRKDDRTLTALLLIIFSATTLLFRDVSQIDLTIRTSSIAAFILLTFVLMIGPLSKFSKSILRMYYFRRHLGVTVFLLGWLHFGLIFSHYFNFDGGQILNFGFTFYGLVAFSIMMWMALTSWNFIQKKVPREWWNYFHAFIMALYAFQAYYFYSIQKAANSPQLSLHAAILSGVMLFWILTAPYGIIKRIMRTKVFGWKQVHVLVYAAYGFLVAHVALGPLLNPALPQWVKVLFWILPALVICAHTAGWIKRITDDKRIYARMSRINSRITENGLEYIGVAKTDEFIEGKGQKFYINRLPVAVFKYGEKFVALSNVCAHQKGPLCDGKIMKGFVICPWHEWEYRVEDGRAPEGHKDAVPYYETKVKNGILYIASRSGKIRKSGEHEIQKKDGKSSSNSAAQ